MVDCKGSGTGHYTVGSENGTSIWVVATERGALPVRAYLFPGHCRIRAWAPAPLSDLVAPQPAVTPTAAQVAPATSAAARLGLLGVSYFATRPCTSTSMRAGAVLSP